MSNIYLSHIHLTMIYGVRHGDPLAAPLFREFIWKSCVSPCFGVQTVNFGDKGKTMSQLLQIIVYFFVFLSRSDQFVYMLQMTHMEKTDPQFHK